MVDVFLQRFWCTGVHVCVRNVPVEDSGESWPAGPESGAAPPAAVFYSAAQPVACVH